MVLSHKMMVLSHNIPPLLSTSKKIKSPKTRVLFPALPVPKNSSSLEVEDALEASEKARRGSGEPLHVILMRILLDLSKGFGKIVWDVPWDLGSLYGFFRDLEFYGDLEDYGFNRGLHGCSLDVLRGLHRDVYWMLIIGFNEDGVFSWKYHSTEIRSLQ